MPAIKIPGAESIDPVAPARDPGVTASPDAFGAQIGASEAHFGDVLSSLGAHLNVKRQNAEDDVYVQKHYVDSSVRMEQAQLKAKQDFPDGGPGYMEALNTGLQQANDSVTADLAARGLRPSDRAASRVATRFAGVQSNALVNGVAYDNNANVKKLQDASTDSINTISAGTKAGTIPLDKALQQVDGVVAAARPVYGGAASRTFEDASKKAVVNGEIERLTRVGLIEEAGKLRDKWFGHTVTKGEGNAGAVATVAENLGIKPRDLAAVISYETGGKMNPSQWGGKGNNYLGLIQFGPEERAKYGVRPGMTFAEQMPAVENFLRDRGLKPGMDVAQIYSIINTGGLTATGQPAWNKSDGNGTIADHVSRIQRDHYAAADKFLTSGAGIGAAGKGDGGGSEALLPDPALSMHWQKQFEAQRTDQVRADHIAKIQQQKISDETENAYLKDLFTDAPKTTVRQIVNDDSLNRVAKERMIGVANRALKEEPIAQVSQQTSTQLMDRIRRPYGDPQKITDTKPIYDELIAGKLSKADFKFVKDEFTNAQTPDGEKLNAKVTSFLHGMKASVTKSNPLMGKIDQSGDQQMYLLENDIHDKVAAARKEGKDPHDLFNPSKPEYLGSPKALEPYQKSLQQSLADRVNTLTKGNSPVTPDTSTPTTPPAPTTTRPLRKPGETPSEYVKRVGL